MVSIGCICQGGQDALFSTGCNSTVTYRTVFVPWDELAKTPWRQGTRVLIP